MSHDLDDAALEIYRRRYDAEVRDTDRYLRTLFGYLKSEGVLDSTLVIITSDHGEAFGEGQFVTHWFNNRGELEATQRVPLLMVFPPSYQPPIREVSAPTSIADIAPTVYELLGIDWLPLVRQAAVGNFGRSLVPHLTAPAVKPPVAETSLDPSLALTAEEEDARQQEAVKRLRALGYIR